MNEVDPASELPGAISVKPWILKNSGAPLLETYQRFRGFQVVLLPPKLLQWGVNPAGLEVTVTQTALSVHSGQQLLLHCQLWRQVLPSACGWTVDGEALRIELTKHESALGSWPYLFEAVAVHCPAGAGADLVGAAGTPAAPCASGAGGRCAAASSATSSSSGSAAPVGCGGFQQIPAGQLGDKAESLQPGRGSRRGSRASGLPEGAELSPPEGLKLVWSLARSKFEQAAAERAKQACQEDQAARAAEKEEIKARLAAQKREWEKEPRVKVAFLLPSDPGLCCRVIQSSRHLPTVAKLLQMSQQVADLESLLDLQIPPDRLPAYVLPVLRFVAGLATVEQLREREGPQVVAAAEACGGNGCGSEYAVLVFGGALELRHAIQILKAHTAVLQAHSLQPAAGSRLSLLGELWDEKEAARAAAEAQARLQSRVAAAVASVLEGVPLREPRIHLYCSGTGMRYASLEAVRSWLPRTAAQVGGERRLLSGWVFVGCHDIWMLEEEDEAQVQGGRSAGGDSGAVWESPA